MSRKFYRKKSRLGLIVTCIGIGMLITFIIPFWGYIIIAGASLIYWGWYLINHCH